LPIVMMTAHASIDYAVAALRHQVDEFLTKPVSAAALVPKVRELADRGAAARRTARALAAVDPETAEPAEASRAERQMLRDLAAVMGQQTSLSQQLEHAAKVQRDLLPRSNPELAGYQFAAACVPSFAIGGDFYDWYAENGGVEFAVADVMGKGIPAALVTATVRAVLRGVSKGQGPGHAMRLAADELRGDLGETGTFVTVFLARLDPATGEVRYADAGHGLGLHVRASGGYQQLVSDALPLGIDVTLGREATPWPETGLWLAPGDRLICFSDGLFDLLGGTKESIDAVATVVAGATDCDDVIRRIVELTGQGTLIDDVTIVAVGRDGESTELQEHG
jgi:serine phosphatase RsbU (regulator of sigma subunit)